MRLAGVLLGRAPGGHATLAVAVATAATPTAVAALLVVRAATLALGRRRLARDRLLRLAVASRARSVSLRAARPPAAASTSHSAGGSSAGGALRARLAFAGTGRCRGGLGGFLGGGTVAADPR